MKTYKFTDGQLGTVAAWQERNAKGEVFGEFISRTGARFTVERRELTEQSPVNQVTAALQTVAGSELLALSRADQDNVAADFAAALAEDNCGAVEYMRRIGSGNLQAYANCLRARGTK